MKMLLSAMLLTQNPADLLVLRVDYPLFDLFQRNWGDSVRNYCLVLSYSHESQELNNPLSGFPNFFWHISTKSVIISALYLINNLYFYPIHIVWSSFSPFWEGFLLAAKGGKTETYIPKAFQTIISLSLTCKCIKKLMDAD